MQKINKIGLLRFSPVFHERIWGGDKLKNVLNKDYESQSIGESWEISSVESNETKVISNNFEAKTLSFLIDKFGENLVGEFCYKKYGNKFPVLIKFLDAKYPLSIQVHPNDEMAKKKHDSFGKNEAWYIMDSEKDSEILLGFVNKTDKNSFENSIKNDSILDNIRPINPQKGEFYNIPSGRIHAIGKGVLIMEIQQTSDITYRVFDYNRVDAKTGKKRELHIKDALEAIDFSDSEDPKVLFSKGENKSNKMIDTPFFKSNFLSFNKDIILRYDKNKSFKIFVCVDGECSFELDKSTEIIRKGECIMLPAEEEELKINTVKSVEIIEISI